jgi:hypothetical protein
LHIPHNIKIASIILSPLRINQRKNWMDREEVVPIARMLRVDLNGTEVVVVVVTDKWKTEEDSVVVVKQHMP